MALMFTSLSATASDEEIIRFIDQWISLLAEEKYAEALNMIKAEDFWKPELLENIIKDNGDAPHDRVTLYNDGTALDGLGNISAAHQRKDVVWYTELRSKEENIGWFDENRGDVWYDLNINGLVSDLTATFDLEKKNRRVHIILNDIHAM